MQTSEKRMMEILEENNVRVLNKLVKVNDFVGNVIRPKTMKNYKNYIETNIKDPVYRNGYKYISLDKCRQLWDAEQTQTMQSPTVSPEIMPCCNKLVTSRDNLLTDFDYKNGLYISDIGTHAGEHLYKFGSFSKRFIRDYKTMKQSFFVFNIVLLIECDNGEVVQSKFRRELEMKNLTRTIEVVGVEHSKVFTGSAACGVDKIIQLMNRLVYSYPLTPIGDDVLVAREQTRQKELDLEMKKIDLQIVTTAEQTDEQVPVQVDIEQLEDEQEPEQAGEEDSDSNSSSSDDDYSPAPKFVWTPAMTNELKALLKTGKKGLQVKRKYNIPMDVFKAKRDELNKP